MKPCVGQLLFCLLSGGESTASEARQFRWGLSLCPQRNCLAGPSGQSLCQPPIPPTWTWVGLSRFGFSRLFELPTLFSLPSAGISCASSQEFIQQGRVTHSFDPISWIRPCFRAARGAKAEAEANPTQDQPVSSSLNRGRQLPAVVSVGLRVPSVLYATA